MRLDVGSALLLLSGFVALVTAPILQGGVILLSDDKAKGTSYFPEGNPAACPSQCQLVESVMVCHHADGLNMVQLANCVKSINSLSIVELRSLRKMCSCSLLDYARLTAEARVITFTPTPCGNYLLQHCRSMLSERGQTIEHIGLAAGLVMEQNEPGWRQATKRHLSSLWNKVNSVYPTSARTRYRALVIKTVKSVFWENGKLAPGTTDRILPFMVFKDGHTGPLYGEGRKGWLPVQDFQSSENSELFGSHWISVEEYNNVRKEMEVALKEENRIKPETVGNKQEGTNEADQKKGKGKNIAEEETKFFEKTVQETSQEQTPKGLEEKTSKTDQEEKENEIIYAEEPEKPEMPQAAETSEKRTETKISYDNSDSQAVYKKKTQPNLKRLILVLAIIGLIIGICCVGIIIQMRGHNIRETKDSFFRRLSTFSKKEKQPASEPEKPKTKEDTTGDKSDQMTQNPKPEEIKRRLSQPYSQWSTSDFQLARELEDEKHKSQELPSGPGQMAEPAEPTELTESKIGEASASKTDQRKEVTPQNSECIQEACRLNCRKEQNTTGKGCNCLQKGKWGFLEDSREIHIPEVCTCDIEARIPDTLINQYAEIDVEGILSERQPTEIKKSDQKSHKIETAKMKQRELSSNDQDRESRNPLPGDHAPFTDQTLATNQAKTTGALASDLDESVLKLLERLENVGTAPVDRNNEQGRTVGFEIVEDPKSYNKKPFILARRATGRADDIIHSLQNRTANCARLKSQIDVNQKIPKDKQAQYDKVTKGKPVLTGSHTKPASKGGESWTQANVFDIVDEVQKEERKPGISEAENKRSVQFAKGPTGKKRDDSRDVFEKSFSFENVLDKSHEKYTADATKAKKESKTDIRAKDKSDNKIKDKPETKVEVKDVGKDNTDGTSKAAGEHKTEEGTGKAKADKSEAKEGTDISGGGDKKLEEGGKRKYSDETKKKKSKSETDSEPEDKDGPKKKSSRKKKKKKEESESEDGSPKKCKKKKKKKNKSDADETPGESDKESKKRKKKKRSQKSGGSEQEEEKKESKEGEKKEGDASTTEGETAAGSEESRKESKKKSKKKKRKDSKSENKGTDDKKGDTKEKGREKKKTKGSKKQSKEGKSRKPGSKKGEKKGRSRSISMPNRNYSASSGNDSSSSAQVSPEPSIGFQSRKGIFPVGFDKHVCPEISNWPPGLYHQSPHGQRLSRSPTRRTIFNKKCRQAGKQGDVSEQGSSDEGSSCKSSHSDVIQMDRLESPGGFVPTRPNRKRRVNCHADGSGKVKPNSVRDQKRNTATKHTRISKSDKRGNEYVKQPRFQADNKNLQMLEALYEGKVHGKDLKDWVDADTQIIRLPEEDLAQFFWSGNGGATENSRKPTYKTKVKSLSEPKGKEEPLGRHEEPRVLADPSLYLFTDNKSVISRPSTDSFPQTKESWKSWFVADTEKGDKDKGQSLIHVCLGLHGVDSALVSGELSDTDNRSDFLDKQMSSFDHRCKTPSPKQRTAGSIIKKPSLPLRGTLKTFGISSMSETAKSDNSLGSAAGFSDSEVKEGKKMTCSPQFVERSSLNHLCSPGTNSRDSPVPKPRSRSRQDQVSPNRQNTVSPHQPQEPPFEPAREVHFNMDESDEELILDRTTHALTPIFQIPLPSDSETDYHVQSLEKMSPEMFIELSSHFHKTEQKKKIKNLFQVVDANASRRDVTPQNSTHMYADQGHMSELQSDTSRQTSEFVFEKPECFYKTQQSKVSEPHSPCTPFSTLSPKQINSDNAIPCTVTSAMGPSLSQDVTPTASSTRSSSSTAYSGASCNEISQSESKRNHAGSSHKKKDVMSSESQPSFYSTKPTYVRRTRSRSSVSGVGYSSAHSHFKN